MRPCERSLFSRLFALGLALSLVILAFRLTDKTSWALPNIGVATVFPPGYIGGASGYGDARDADIGPVVAYDSFSKRYLAAWFTARNAGSSSDGFDIYGRFLDHAGQPTGSEFRISDDNTAARNGLPAVAAGDGEFAVTWTAKGDTCRIYVQRITDASRRTDRLLVSGAGHLHSPTLIYNPALHMYVLAYVAGDDYLPPTLYGVDTSDCGNNASSASGIRAVEFHFDGDSPITGTVLDVPTLRGAADVNGGSFRPHLAYSSALDQHLVAWEDRRNAAGQAYRFDVYAQRLSGDMVITGSDIALATGGDYTNYDTSATWTPRPAVAGGDDRFLVTWFSREAAGSAAIWSAKARLVSSEGTPGPVFSVAQMSFAQPHAGQSPTGFLSAAYASTAREYLVGMTSHLESVWGYLSSARVQRVSRDGQLLKMDGSLQNAPGVGYSIDYENDDQITIGLAVNPPSEEGAADYVAVYTKHQMDRTAQDFDIWRVRIQIPAVYLPTVYLPLVSQR